MSRLSVARPSRASHDTGPALTPAIVISWKWQPSRRKRRATFSVSLMPSRVRHRACEGVISSRVRLLAAVEWGVRHVCLRDLRRDVLDVEARSLETIRTLPRAAAADAVR